MTIVSLMKLIYFSIFIFILFNFTKSMMRFGGSGGDDSPPGRNPKKIDFDLNDPYPMDDEEINDAQQGVSNWQLEEGELQPEQGRAPQKGGPRKEMRIPGRKVPTKEEKAAYQIGQLIPLGGRNKRPPTKFEINSPSKHLQRAISFQNKEFNSPGKSLQKSASFSYSKTSEKQSARRAMQFGGAGNFL
uniref:Uncharacterized protein n=1 Tax=Meloidogyne incognita TaxID=6306 RepID=A0A914KXC5_MELIC